MTSFLTDSMARDHINTIQASSEASRRARQARLARKDARATAKAQRAAESVDTGTYRGAPHHLVSAAHIAAWPFTAFQGWLAAGQL